MRILFENYLPRVKERLSRIEDVGVLACYSKRYHDLCTEDIEYTSFYDDRKAVSQSIYNEFITKLDLLLIVIYIYIQYTSTLHTYTQHYRIIIIK